MKKIVLLIVVYVISVAYSCAVGQCEECVPKEDVKAIEESLEALGEMEENIIGFIDADSISKKLDGKIKKIKENMLFVVTKESEEIILLTDAATVVYIEDEKATEEDLQAGDEIFAYYIEEYGENKADWIEVNR